MGEAAAWCRVSIGLLCDGRAESGDGPPGRNPMGELIVVERFVGVEAEWSPEPEKNLSIIWQGAK